VKDKAGQVTDFILHYGEGVKAKKMTGKKETYNFYFFCTTLV
jgi:hypothetical protein